MSATADGPGGRWRAERVVLRLARPYLRRLLGAGLLATATELAALALMATATWLLMSVPRRTPCTAFSMLPSFLKLNTKIGMSCSMHYAMAVGSITRRFCSRTAL